MLLFEQRVKVRNDLTFAMKKCSQCGTLYDGAELFCPHDGARVVPIGEEVPDTPMVSEEADAYIGKVIQGRYRVLKRLGEGGMGVVYVAEHIEIEKKVALKVLRDDFSKRPEVVERFRQEARSASKIGHPHIVDVTDFGQLEDGGVFFAMECLEGCGLNEICRGEPVPMERAVPIVEQIARALKAAHDKGIVHRDLKPENVFLVNRDDHRDFVKILDFGIAKISDRDNEGKRLTKTGMIFGTPEYMSPEQAAGKALDHRVDIYALGCIMFELFTGRVPYDGDSFMAVLTQHMFEPIPAIEAANPRTDVPASVRAVVYKAMAKEVQDRYSDMDQLRADLERALVDANYIVEHPDRETTIRFDVKGTVGGKPTADKIATMMDWNPKSQGFKKAGGASKMPLVIGIAAAVLLVGGGAAAYFGGFLSFEKERSSAADVAPTTAVTKVAASGGENSAEGASNGAEPGRDAVAKDTTNEVKPSDTQIAAQENVKVSITTSPEGAVIQITGMGQVCSSAPCEVELEQGKTVEVKAVAAGREEAVSFTPSLQNKELEIVVKPRTSGSKPGGKSKSGGKSGGDEDTGKSSGKSGDTKTPSGLKVPDLFKDN